MMVHEIHEKIAKLTARKGHLISKLDLVTGQIFDLEMQLEDNRSIQYNDSGLYVIKSANYYKIGFASNLNDRLSTLQTSTPFTLRVVVFIPCSIAKAVKLETRLHHLFADKNKRGEWFKLTHLEIKRIILFGHKYAETYPLQNLFDPSQILKAAKRGLVSESPDESAVFEIISELQGPEKAAVLAETILDCAEEIGIDRKAASEIIELMRRDGEVFEPRPGYIKLP